MIVLGWSTRTVDLLTKAALFVWKTEKRTGGLDDDYDDGLQREALEEKRGGEERIGSSAVPKSKRYLMVFFSSLVEEHYQPWGVSELER